MLEVVVVGYLHVQTIRALYDNSNIYLELFVRVDIPQRRRAPLDERFPTSGATDTSYCAGVYTKSPSTLPVGCLYVVSQLLCIVENRNRDGHRIRWNIARGHNLPCTHYGQTGGIFRVCVRFPLVLKELQLAQFHRLGLVWWMTSGITVLLYISNLSKLISFINGFDLTTAGSDQYESR